LILALAVLSVSPFVSQSVYAQDPVVLARVDSTARASLPALQGMAVMRGGRLAWERYWGGADSATAFNVKSVSKSLLSALVGVAVEQRKVTLDQTVASILPGLYPKSPPPANRMFRPAVVQNDSARATITVRQLLTMTSGYAWDEGGPVLAAFIVSTDPVRLVAESQVATVPGQTWNYTTGGTHLLAAALTQAVGAPLEQWARANFFGPAGIRLEGWDVDGAGKPVGGSEMFLTIRGLARFGQLYLGRGTIDGKRILPAAWVDTSFAKLADIASPRYKEMISGLDGYGYLWWRRQSSGHTMIGALGHGGQFSLVVPSLDLVIAGASALDGRNPGVVPQFQGIFRLVDQIVASVSR